MHLPLRTIRHWTLRAATLGTTMWLTASCQSAVAPVLNEQWVADLVASRQVLYLTFPPTASAVSGRGTLSGLLETGGEALTVKGSRRADTLDLVLVRTSGAQHRLLATYVANRAGLSGQLSGGEFEGLRVNFRKP